MTQTDLIPVFNQSELAAAFSQFLPSDAANRISAQWFALVSPDEMDRDGRYMCLRPPRKEEPAQARVTRVDHQVSRSADTYADLGKLSDADLEERLLSFSSFHLALVSLISQGAARRIESALDLDAKRAGVFHQSVVAMLDALRRRTPL